MIRTVTHSCNHRWSYDCGPAAERLTPAGERMRRYVETLSRGPCPGCGSFVPMIPGEPAKDLGTPDFICRR